LNDVNSFIGTANLTAANIKSIGPAIDAIQAQFQSADQGLVGSLYSTRDGYRQVHSQLTRYLQSLAQATVIQMVQDAFPLAAGTLASTLPFLISQMVSTAQTVQKPTVSTTPTPGTNVGAGILYATPLAANGIQNDYASSETISGTCTTDGQGTGTAGQEAFTFVSPAAESSTLAFDWPLGSGVSKAQNAVDALSDNTGGNLLQNGSFKTWTNPTVGPDNWLLGPGADPAQITQATGANVYKGASGLAIIGDGTTLTAINQPFKATTSTAGNSGGTGAALKPLTQYAINCVLRLSVVPAAGVLEIDLTDGLGNILNDAAGTPNSLSISLPGGTTSFVAHGTFFRTPAVVPATGYRLRVRLTTALSAGSTLYFGHLALQAASPLYAGGPSLALFSGSPDFILGDNFSVTASNNYGSKWQLLADRLFGMRALGLQLPSGGSPTVLDSLIA
jgi:hypothetical protein